MRYKTIVLTRRKILLFAATLAVIAAACALGGIIVSGIRHTALPAMSYGDDFKAIISETIPRQDTDGANIIEKILGMKTDSPETIIGEYSGSLNKNAEYGGFAPENSYDTAKDTESPPQMTQNSAGDLPSHEQICASVGLKISNATAFKVNLNEMCAGESGVRQEGDAPTVLIVHTHTTECYRGDEMSGETERTTDENLNVIAVGNEIASVLEDYGIKTIHDTTYHDYPSYQGSYTRALKTTEKILKENPSIKAVLDVHRDAFVYEDGSRLRVACEQNGIQTAQVMLVVGTNAMGLWHDNWRDNLTFASKIQNAAEIMYPGLMRPVNLRTERFNGHTTRGSLILEVGSNGNTLEEAKEGGRDVARAIAAVILNG